MFTGLLCVFCLIVGLILVAVGCDLEFCVKVLDVVLVSVTGLFVSWLLVDFV